MAKVNTPKELAWQAAYNKRPEEAAKRSLNNKARYVALKDGKVKVGDGKDIAHVKALNNGGTNTPGNTKVQPAKKNRGWRKGESGYVVP